MTNANQVLAKATEILSRPVGTRGSFAWTKGDLARRGNNHSVDVDDNKACKFCSIGAVDRAAFELGIGIRSKARDQAILRLSRVMTNTGEDWNIATLNDRKSTTFGQVLIAFDLAQTSAGDK